MSMQFYPVAPNVAGQRPEYMYGAPGSNHPRMNWSPTMPGPWPHYDFSAYPGGYPPPVSVDSAQRSPAYHTTSPNQVDHSSSTSHNIRDILGQQGALQSEVAKTPSSYQKSPTSTASGATVFSPEHHMRSPTTPTAPYSTEMPASFYMPRPIPGTCLYFHTVFTSLCSLMVQQLI